CGRQCVSTSRDERLGGVIDVSEPCREGTERSDEQPEREDREQEPVGDLGGESRYVVLLDAVDESVPDGCGGRSGGRGLRFTGALGRWSRAFNGLGIHR